MAKTLYCWRCQMDVPMLDEGEWQRVSAAFANSISRARAYREAHGVSLEEARQWALSEVLTLYRELTGFAETNSNALWHHRIALYGPACRQCGKVLRTPVAKRCVECGAVRGG
jgi:hypothetical protein